MMERGCEGFIDKTPEEFKRMLDKALALGIHFIDMYTPNPAFRDNLGAAMKGRRRELVLQGHVCSAWEDGQYLRTRNVKKTREAFEDQIKRLGTDYLDIGMSHYVDSVWRQHPIMAQGQVPETVADHYKLLEHHASECIACGGCEGNCPFGVGTIEKMKKAVEVFG